MKVTKTHTSAAEKLSTAHPAELNMLAAEACFYGFYRWQDVAINVWTAQPTGEAVEVLLQLTERSLRECPAGIASIHWLSEGVGLPTAQARAGLGEIARRYERHLSCVGVMLQGSGFWASATRSALTGVVLLAPRAFSLRFFGDVPALSAFVQREHSEHTGVPLDAERVASAIEAARCDFASKLA